MEYSYHLQQRFPSLHVTAEILQPPARNQMIAQGVGVAQIVGFCVAFFGDQIFAALSAPVPDWAKYLQDNRGMAIFAWFLSNMFVNSLTQTGAFELYLGGELIHSKIKTGVVPDFNFLVARINSMNPNLANAPRQGTDKDYEQKRRIEQRASHGSHNTRAQLPENDEEDDEL